MMKIYNNIYMKKIFEDKRIIDDFKMSDEFFKQFVRSNREQGFVLYMLTDLKKILNSILNDLRKNKENIIDAYIIGYNNYNKIYLSFFIKDTIILTKQPYLRHAIIKNVISNNNSLLLQIQINKIENNECLY